MELNIFDIAAFLAFFVVVVGFSMYKSRREKNSEEYFLAGRGLTLPTIINLDLTLAVRIVGGIAATYTTWGVLKQIKQCNIRKCSIYLHKMENDKYYRFSYFEYVGDDFAADMQRMAADPTTQKWWQETVPCLFPVKHRNGGEVWAVTEETLHCD